MFALLSLFPCVILHTMWSGKSLQLLCILSFCILCLSAIRMFVDNLLAMYVGGNCGLGKSGLCVLDKSCPVGFLVV